MTVRQNRTLSVLLHFVFFLSGIATVLIGQVLPILAARFELSDLYLGYLFPAQFGGSLIGTLLTNWFGKSGRLVRATAIGAALMAAGFIMMNLGSYELLVAAFLVNGLGLGLTLPAINILILELNPANSASALNFLNFFWGVGAIISKPFVDATAAGTSLALTTTLLAVPMAASAIWLFVVPSGGEAKISRSTGEGEGQTAIWSTPMAWAIALFGFIHVGFEGGMGGWLTTYTARVEGGTSADFISPTFLYFLFFVIGRGVAPAFFRFLDENKVIFLSLIMILAGLAIALTADGSFQLSVGAAISGFGTSSVFPTNVSRFSKAFGPEAMRRATPLFLCGTLGATVVTWLIGYLSDRTGSLRSGMFVLVVSVLLLIVLQLILTFRVSEERGQAALPN